MKSFLTDQYPKQREAKKLNAGAFEKTPSRNDDEDRNSIGSPLRVDVLLLMLLVSLLNV